MTWIDTKDLNGLIIKKDFVAISKDQECAVRFFYIGREPLTARYSTNSDRDARHKEFAELLLARGNQNVG